MEKIKIPTSFNIELDFETPEFHKRLFAWVIDLVIIFAYIIITVSIAQRFSAAYKSADNDLPFLYNMSAVYLLLFVPVLVYHLFFEVVMNGQSIGKKLIGIKVIGEDGRRPALHQTHSTTRCNGNRRGSHLTYKVAFGPACRHTGHPRSDLTGHFSLRQASGFQCMGSGS